MDKHELYNLIKSSYEEEKFDYLKSICEKHINIFNKYNMSSVLINHGYSDLYKYLYSENIIDVTRNGTDNLIFAINKDQLDLIKIIVEDENFKQYIERNDRTHLVEFIKVRSLKVFDFLINCKLLSLSEAEKFDLFKNICLKEDSVCRELLNKHKFIFEDTKYAEYILNKRPYQIKDYVNSSLFLLKENCELPYKICKRNTKIYTEILNEGLIKEIHQSTYESIIDDINNDRVDYKFGYLKENEMFLKKLTNKLLSKIKKEKLRKELIESKKLLNIKNI